MNKADYTTNIGELNANVNGMESRVLVVTYTNGAKGTFEITVTAPEMAGITITNWDKTIGLGGVYNKDSVVIAAILGNGTTGQITVPGTVSISDVVTSVAGEVEFTVTYTTEAGATYTATAKVTVLSISRLEVSGVPAVVNRGEALDLSKMKVTAFFSDGSSRVVNVSEITTTTPDTSAGGNKAFTVKYLGFDQTVSYHVRSITSIKILSGSVNTALRAGYEVDVSGLILDITYSNGDREQKKASELTGVTYTGTGKGSTTFTVTFKYNENEKCSDSVSLTQITVTKISALNNTIPSLVMQGTKLDFSSMSLSVYYDNGEVYLVPLPEPGKDPVDPYLTVDYSGVDTSKPGSQAISFYYRDGISINHAYDALLGAGAINAAQYEVLKYNFDTSVNFTVRGIATVEIVAGTVYDKIYVGKTVDTSGISVKVTYDDGTYIYVNRNNTALTVYDSKDDIDTSKEGKVKLWVEFSGVRGSMDIEVEKMPETSGVIVGVLLPDTIVARESYKKNFLDYSPERPSNPYYVGDDNLFYFYLDVIELDENDNVVEKDGKKTPTAGKVYLVDGNTETELTGDNLALYVTVDYSKNSYDFTENAIGKTFRLEIRPDGTSENTSLKRSYSVTVVDGYNVYEAWELNVMTNVHRDITQKCFGADGMIYQDKVVDEFLLGKGVTRPATLASIVLHGNLDVKLSDIPPEYSYVDEKGVNQGLYNQLGVFHRELTTEQKEFKIYGNYFSVYSYSLPCVVPNNVANNTKDGGFSSSALFKSTLSSGACDYIRGKATKEAFSEFVVNIQDIATRDNDPNSNDQTASERHMRGLSCYKVGEMRVDMTAVNVEAFMTSVVCENMGSTLNLNKVKLYNAWQTHLFLWNQNEIQNTKEGEKAETWGYVPNLTVNINSSEITKCGGPVILAQAPNVDELYNRTCGVEVHVDEKLVSADDNKSKLSTYVTGQEAWFVAVGQTQIAAQVRAMSTTIGNGCGFTSTGHIQGVETVNMIMVAMGNNGTSLNGTTSNVLYSRDGKVVMQSHHPENKTTFQTTVRDNTIEYVIAQDPANYAPLRYAPLFETETGGLGYIDASMKCNPLNASLYTGDYITLYYTSLGANIMMEYYSVNP